MKSIGSISLLAFVLIISGCGQDFAPKNPLAGSIAPLPASCPDMFNFEPPQTLAGWSAPTWPGGLIAYQIDTAHAYCGTHSMRIDMNLGGSASRSAEVAYYFSQLEVLSNAHKSLWIYFDQRPPAAVKLDFTFTNQALGWTEDTATSGFSAGWTNIAALAIVPSPGASGILLDFSSGTTLFQGSVWIDEINW